MRISWCEAARHFDESVEGRLPDGFVHGTGENDHVMLLDRYRTLGWPTERDDRHVDTVDPRPPEDDRTTILVFPDPTVSVNLFLWAGGEIDFDVDAREIHDQDTFDAVCRFLAQTGRALGKDVDLCPEGTTAPFLRYRARTDSVGLCP